MSLSKASYPNIDTLNIEGLRFGFPAEDVLATEERLFDASTFPFTITGFGNGLNLIQTDNTNWLNALAISDVIVQLQANGIPANTNAFVSLAPNGTLQIESNDAINSLLATILMTPALMKFTQTDGLYQFDTVPVFTDNAAALLGGLIAGQIYRDGDNLKIVH